MLSCFMNFHSSLASFLRFVCVRSRNSVLEGPEEHPNSGMMKKNRFKCDCLDTHNERFEMDANKMKCLSERYTGCTVLQLLVLG